MTGFDIWNELGNTYFKTGAYDQAIDAYSKAIELNPKFGWSYSNLALAYTHTGKLSEAISLYQKSIELLSDKLDKAISWNRLGDAYRQLNEYDNAAAAYETADKLNPNRAALNGAVPDEKIISDKKETDTPVSQTMDPPTIPNSKHSGGIHEIDLKNAHIWNELGNIFVKAGNYDDAIDAYNKAILLDPAFAWPYSNLALAHTYKGNFSEAIPLYKKSIELFTNSKEKAISWDRLGDVYRRLTVYKDAIAAYEIAKKLSQESDTLRSDLREVNIEQILLHPRQTRIRAGVDELAGSIRVHGIIQPLIVCPNTNEPGKFTLIAGKRRLEAARQIGLERVPVIVRQSSEQEMLELVINENIHHADPNPLELAESYQQLVDDFGMSEEELAASIGKTRYMVANNLRLLELPEDVKQAIACKRISEIHARLLFTLASAEMQSTALQYILRNELSIQQTEDLIRRMSSIKAITNSAPANLVREEQGPAQENAMPAPQKSDTYRPENTPLLTRTRFILMSNPRPERKSQLVSS
jgi:ParB family chromosome partitioning protein